MKRFSTAAIREYEGKLVTVKFISGEYLVGFLELPSKGYGFLLSDPRLGHIRFYAKQVESIQLFTDELLSGEFRNRL